MYILSIDEGTTLAKAIIWDDNFEIKGYGSKKINNIYSNKNYVEQNPEEIYNSQLFSIKMALKSANLDFYDIDSIGITNQRESIILWNKNNGMPVYNAILWQDHRTSKFTDELKNNYYNLIKNKTGLIPDAYFSASKIKWILENIDKSKDLLKNNNLIAGTIDTWLMYKLSNKKIIKTDYTNASRTILFNINNLKWDNDLIDLFKIPDILPDVYKSCNIFGYTDKSITKKEIEINAVSGDQNSSLFGHTAFYDGNIKNTYGTGSFLLMATDNIIKSNKLINTIGYSVKNKTKYAVEGSIFNAGSSINWLLNLFKNINFDDIIKKSNNINNLYFVPAFNGLGSPYWDSSAKSIIKGIKEYTNKYDLLKSAIESIAFQSNDIIKEMRKYKKIKNLNADGGASKNDYLMQFQSNISDLNVIRKKTNEITSLGIAYLSALSEDLIKFDDLKNYDKIDKIFEPEIKNFERNKLLKGWKNSIKSSLN